MAVSELAKTNGAALAAQAPPEIDKLLVLGDLSKLTPEQKANYYMTVCRSMGLNPYTKPFGYLSLNGALQLYAKKDAAEQLRGSRGISITSLTGEVVDDLYVVTCRGRDRTGREDQATGAVVIGNLKGEAKANALMKAETKAKRRFTLSICGLGFLDESEIESIKGAEIIDDVELPAGEVPSVSVPAAAEALGAMAAAQHAPPPPVQAPAAEEAASQTNDRAAYWATHNERGYPPHEGELKALNYEVWWKVLGSVYDGGKNIPPSGWAILRRWLGTLPHVNHKTGELVEGKNRVPKVWQEYIDSRKPAEPVEATIVPDPDADDPFADE